MWKSILANFFILSFIIYSGEYIRYKISISPQVIRENKPEVNTLLKTNISGSLIRTSLNKTSRTIVISGVKRVYRTRAYHICGIKTNAAILSEEIKPIGEVRPSSFLITTSS